MYNVFHAELPTNGTGARLEEFALAGNECFSLGHYSVQAKKKGKYDAK